MNLRILVLIFAFILTSCSQRNSLADDLACSRFITLGNTIDRTDFNKHFQLKIPETWKNQGYFDEFQSSILAADTIKQLTETYILDVAYKYGEIELDNSFVSQVNTGSDLEVLRSNFEPFKELPSYWQIAKGNKNGYTYHVFQQFAKQEIKGYIEIKTEFYGGEMVDERLCESLAIINTLELHHN